MVDYLDACDVHLEPAAKCTLSGAMTMQLSYISSDKGRFHFEADGAAGKLAFRHPLLDRDSGDPVLGHKLCKSRLSAQLCKQS